VIVVIIEELYLKANFLVNPVLQPTLKVKSILKNEIIKRATKGIYFIKDEESIDKIIEESMISSPEPFISYGLKKPIFYAGIPDFALACFDFKLPKILTAIKLDMPYERLALFQIEFQNNTYKLFYPNLLTEPLELKKVYLGLKIEDYKICYREIKKSEIENYEIKIPITDVKLIEKKMAKDLKEYLKKLRKKKNQIKK
jgi:hypothetical protein